MNRGESAASPSASRKRLMAAFSPCSKSRKVLSGPELLAQLLAGHELPGVVEQPRQHPQRLLLQRNRTPALRTSPDRQIDLKGPEPDELRRSICCPETSSAPGSGPEAEDDHHTLQGTRGDPPPNACSIKRLRRHPHRLRSSFARH